MELDEFRSILSNSRADVWSIIDAAISVASIDHGHDLKDRRDGIVEKLYSQCRNRDLNHQQQPNDVVLKAETDSKEEGESPLTPQSNQRDDEDEDEPDPYGGLFDDEESKILTIKEQLEDLDQPEDSVVELLQNLADMDLTFKVLKETDIGRHVNRLRKHPSNEVRTLVKQLVRKWKDLVDEWVGSNHTEPATSTLIGNERKLERSTNGNSPLLHNIPRNVQNGHHQVPDFAYSPNQHNGSSGSDRNNSEPEQLQRPKPAVPKREIAPSRPPTKPISASAPPNSTNRESSIDLDRLASARRRLHENYQEAQNAKKQRTIQVMDIHEIPKPKNGFIAKNKGGFQGRHHR